MNKINIIIIFLIVIIFFIMFNYLKPNFFQKKSFNNLNDGEMVSISFGKKDFLVEVANSANSTRQGLSDRDEIGSDGMLFLFPDKTIRTFWMLRMGFDLDFVWINDNKVVGVNKGVKKPDSEVKNQDLELISINKQTDKVLELNSGDIDRYEIEVGDVVIIK